MPVVTAANLHTTFIDLTEWTIAAVRTPPAGGAKAKYKKREGAKKVNEFERAMSGADGLRTSEAATLYQALSARANDLS